MKTSQKIPKNYTGLGTVHFNNKIMENLGLDFSFTIFQMIIIAITVGFYILTTQQFLEVWQVWTAGILATLYLSYLLSKKSNLNKNQLNIKSLALYFLRDKKIYRLNLIQEQQKFLKEIERNENEEKEE